MTPTKFAIAVDRLAKAANSNAVYGTDYVVGQVLANERPNREEGETSDSFFARIEAWRATRSVTWEITKWDEEVLGPKPTQQAIAAEAGKSEVPPSVGMAQLREQLIVDGLLDSVNTAIAAIPDATERAIVDTWWEYATDVLRDNPKVAMVAGALGLTEAQVDAIFINASQRL